VQEKKTGPFATPTFGFRSGDKDTPFGAPIRTDSFTSTPFTELSCAIPIRKRRKNIQKF
jgi:hypothetical protein